MAELHQLRNTGILITGGAGFIGSAIASRLADENRVTVVDDLSRGSREAVPQGATLHEIGIEELVADDLTNVDYVFHLAANVSVPRSVREPIYDAERNVMGTLRVLKAADEAGVERVVYSSSSAIYGHPTTLPVDEEHRKRPTSPYANSKLAGENYCRLFAELYGLETTILRYFNVYGPGQRGDHPYAGVVAKFLDRHLRGKSLTVHGDGEQTRDFVHVDDVVETNVRAATVPGVSGTAFNVGSGRSRTVNEVADALDEVTDRTVTRRYADSREGDIDRSQAATGRMEDELGFAPAVSFDRGMKETVEWYRQSVIENE